MKKNITLYIIILVAFINILVTKSYDFLIVAWLTIIIHNQLDILHTMNKYLQSEKEVKNE